MTPTSANPELEVVSSTVREPVEIAAPRQEHSTIARLRLLWDNRRFLFRATLWGLLASALIAFLIPKEFQSTTRLMPPDDQSGSGLAMVAALSGKLGSGLGSLAGDALGLKSSGDLFIAILKSRTVQDDLVNKFDLRKVYWKSQWDAARQELVNRTSISEDRKSGVIAITVTDRSPKRAAAMAQEYVTELNTVVSQVNTSSAHRERVFLEQRLEQVKQDLQSAEHDFSEFASKTGAIDIKEQGRAMLTAAATLQGEYIAAQSELEGLRQIYTENNVRVRALRARIAELRQQLEKVGGKTGITGEITSSNDDSVYPSIRKLPLLGVSYADLYRRTKVQEAVFEALTQQYEMAKVQEAKETPSVKVLDPADVPESKSFPPRLAIIVVGVLITIAIASALILGKARLLEIDDAAPGKLLATEVLQAVNQRMPWSPPNGSRLHALSHRAWRRIHNRPEQQDADRFRPR